MLSEDNKQKLLCLSGQCKHTSTDSTCLFLKSVDKEPDYWFTLFEKIVEDEIKLRGKKVSKNEKRKKAIRK